MKKSKLLSFLSDGKSWVFLLLLVKSFVVQCSEKNEIDQFFSTIFAQKKLGTFLEFGISSSTSFFLDHCDQVISVEFVTRGYGPESARSYLEQNQAYSNWIPIIYFSGVEGDAQWAKYKYLGSKAVYYADAYQCGLHKHYAQVDGTYLKELSKFISNITKSNRVDIAFVNPSNYLRGDLVQLLFDKVPVIVAHSFRKEELHEENPYGYQRIVPPEQYDQIVYEQGFVMWVHKDITWMER